MSGKSGRLRFRQHGEYSSIRLKKGRYYSIDRYDSEPHPRGSLPLTLNKSYLRPGFTTGGYAIRKLICGGCGRVFYTTIYTKKYCHSYWCGNQANNRRQREYRQMRRQDLVCQCCGEKFTPKRAGARYCSNACRQKDYRKRVTDAASGQNDHIIFPQRLKVVENQVAKRTT